jgi:hypothetical protein
MVERARPREVNLHDLANSPDEEIVEALRRLPRDLTADQLWFIIGFLAGRLRERLHAERIGGGRKFDA